MNRGPHLGVAEGAAVSFGFILAGIAGLHGSMTAGHEYWQARMAQFGALNNDARYAELEERAGEAWLLASVDAATALGSLAAGSLLLRYAYRQAQVGEWHISPTDMPTIQPLPGTTVYIVPPAETPPAAPLVLPQAA